MRRANEARSRAEEAAAAVREDLMGSGLGASHSYSGDYDLMTSDWAAIKGAIKDDLSGYLYKKTKRSPMILPVIMEV